MGTNTAMIAGVARPQPVGRAFGRFLQAPVSRRTWAEFCYALVGMPLGVLGLGYLVVTVLAGAALSITLLGLPLLAAGPLGARRFGAVHRELARALLGVDVGAPGPRRRTPGFSGWVRSGVGDAAGWRAVLYLVLKVPIAIATLGLAVAFWGYGLAGLSYPAWWTFLPCQQDSRGVCHQGAALPGDFALDTWPRALLVAAVGLLLLLAAPWVVRGVLAMDRRLVRGLLGPTMLSQRVRELEQSRAHAVDDSAARLRRIERDLHDGAQAQLVALAMKLGLAKEELEGDDPKLQRTRGLVDAAHRASKQALDELRDLARGIHPPVLDNGLDPALATLAARSTVPVQLHVEVPDRPSAVIETIAYFCTAELLTNVAKHRVATVDGRLVITSPPGGPTVVTVELPSRI